jgi:hypothetical protein
MRRKIGIQGIWFMFGLLSFLAVVPASGQVVKATVKINGMI